jgi:hypothetical protein
MARKRPNEPIGPTTVPGEPTDPKIPPSKAPKTDSKHHPGDRLEKESEQPLRESEQAMDRALTHLPPD